MLYKIATVREVPEGGALVVQGHKEEEIALFKVKGEIYALENTCPHMGGPLGEGECAGGVVTCPWHGWAFDVKTGSCQNVEEGRPAKRVAVTVRSGNVFIER